ncbi:HlyC/CorC family transporter [Psychrosphaera aestuarii]|uniref:HlyC/CorC family transporter n=1 Tax=Psychrosphaera aestuarii TaxID=1266052 RepID=UPI001B3404D1|nr:transporter associated domain-containing protein [Psychrosphaera aestuarii]
MSDDNPHSSNGSSNKGWIEKLGQLFTDEPKSKEDVANIIDVAAQNDLIDLNTKNMIDGVMEIADLRIRDIMIPRSQMITLDLSDTPDKFIPLMIESGHSRFPVVTEDKDHVEGILLAKDLLSLLTDREQEIDLQSLLRPIVIVPESKRVDTLLREFRLNRYHMAIVVDEYGGVSGLVTIEDILELIVGEIEDEFDSEDNQTDNIRKVSKHVYMVQALTELDDFNEFFKSDFDEEEADTIGGIVLHEFGHMPEKGEEVLINNIKFKVQSSDTRRIQQLMVTLPKKKITKP